MFIMITNHSSSTFKQKLGEHVVGCLRCSSPGRIANWVIYLLHLLGKQNAEPVFFLLAYILYFQKGLDFQKCLLDFPFLPIYQCATTDYGSVTRSQSTNSRKFALRSCTSLISIIAIAVVECELNNVTTSSNCLILDCTSSLLGIMSYTGNGIVATIATRDDCAVKSCSVRIIQSTILSRAQNT